MFVTYKVYLFVYFKSEKFREIKAKIKQHTNDCNALNEHIEELKLSYFEVSSHDGGQSNLQDTSYYNMRRRKWSEETKSARTHNCSAVVCKNAHNQPFKYLCKYFNISINEETLSTFEWVLNNFSAAEQGKSLLKNERDSIVSGISSQIPSAVLFLSRARVIRELGFHKIDLSSLYFPVFSFQYVSAGGNSSLRCDIVLNIQNLDKFVVYLNESVQFRKSVAGQRSLMTSSLREKIKSRDKFTCQICSISTDDERNLLLEIDHIVPLSKGGMTSEDNLQTLCWRCNRSKGAKIIPTQ